MNGSESTRADLVALYLDNQLDADGKAAFEAELEKDAALRNELRTWQTMRNRLRSAVNSQPVPPSLESAILARTSQGPRNSYLALFGPFRLAAAAALCAVLAVSIWWMTRQREFSLADFPPQVAAMMEIGVGKHVSCVKERIGSSVHPLGSFNSEVPPEFKKMLEAAKRALPADFTLVEMHMCGSKGREFAHLTLTRGDGYLSVLLTERKDSDPVPSDNRLASATIGDVNIYAAGEDGMEVDVFALPKQYAFVVSDYGRSQNLRFAKEVAEAID